MKTGISSTQIRVPSEIKHYSYINTYSYDIFIIYYIM